MKIDLTAPGRRNRPPPDPAPASRRTRPRPGQTPGRAGPHEPGHQEQPPAVRGTRHPGHPAAAPGHASPLNRQATRDTGDPGCLASSVERSGIAAGDATKERTLREADGPRTIEKPVEGEHHHGKPPPRVEPGTPHRNPRPARGNQKAESGYSQEPSPRKPDIKP